MSDRPFYRRLVDQRLVESLNDSPVVLIHGPRQSGKTTLAQYTCAPDFLSWGGENLMLGGDSPSWGLTLENRDYAYFTFDDPVVREGARSDPLGFVADLPDRVILDEVQYVPELFEAIKIAVDRERSLGRFLLTGSTNPLLIPHLSESLAGRLQVVRLHALSRYELERKLSDPSSSTTFLNDLFEGGIKSFRAERLGDSLVDIVLTGGYPRALALPTHRRRANWYRNYIDTLISREVRDTTNIRSLHVMPSLVRAAATQTARLFNLSSLAAPFGESKPTIEKYVALLENVFVLEHLSAWRSNRLSRLVKAPKVHVTDTGLAAAMMGVDDRALKKNRTLFGQLLETFVFDELRRQASWQETPASFYHYRDKDGVEVDVVIELESGLVAGVEVKASATAVKSDFRGLRKLADAVGDDFAHGVLLYDGETCIRFGDRLHAVPIRRLWEAL